MKSIIAKGKASSSIHGLLLHFTRQHLSLLPHLIMSTWLTLLIIHNRKSSPSLRPLCSIDFLKRLPDISFFPV